MVILVDTNIILDVIASREPFVTESRKILELCAKQEIKGYIAFHSVFQYLFHITEKVFKRRTPSATSRDFKSPKSDWGISRKSSERTGSERF